MIEGKAVDIGGELGKQAKIRTEKLRKFYRLAPNGGGLVGFELENETVILGGRAVLAPPPERRGFRDFPEAPRFRFGKRRGRLGKLEGRPPRDIEMYHDYWFISDLTKRVFESVDPAAFAFVKCDVVMSNGDVGPDYWLCDVVRVLDVVDEEASVVKKIYHKSERWSYDMVSPTSLVFKEQAVGSAHVFRMAHYDFAVICDDSVRAACKAAGLKMIAFRDVVDL